MSKKELIQIRVTKDEKQKIKILSAKKRLTITEYLLYYVMKTISEDELIDIYYKK